MKHFFLVINELDSIYHFLSMLLSLAEMLQIIYAQIQQAYQLIWQEPITLHIGPACMIEAAPASIWCTLFSQSRLNVQTALSRATQPFRSNFPRAFLLAFFFSFSFFFLDIYSKPSNLLSKNHYYNSPQLSIIKNLSDANMSEGSPSKLSGIIKKAKSAVGYGKKGARAGSPKTGGHCQYQF